MCQGNGHGHVRCHTTFTSGNNPFSPATFSAHGPYGEAVGQLWAPGQLHDPCPGALSTLDALLPLSTLWAPSESVQLGAGRAARHILTLSGHSLPRGCSSASSFQMVVKIAISLSSLWNSPDKVTLLLFLWCLCSHHSKRADVLGVVYQGGGLEAVTA